MAMEMEIEMKKNFDLLPPEITADILSRVAADSVSNCKLVCKTWRSHIDHPSFPNDHTLHVYLNDDSSMDFFVSTYFSNRTREEYKLHHGEYNEGKIIPFKLNDPITHHPFPLEPLYNFDPDLNINYHFDPMDIISCNGLIFTGSALNPFDMLYIYNPFTREYVDLLPGFITSGIFSEIYNNPCFIDNGFGYHLSTNEYKIVRICYSDEKTLGHASVYTLGSGKWTSLGEISHKLFCRNGGVFANGAIYWLECCGEWGLSKRIVSFDLGDEKFRIFSLPVQQTRCVEIGVLRGCLCVISPQSENGEIGVLRGCLCVISPQSENGYHTWDIWMTENKECSSWTRKFNLPWKYDLTQNALVGITKGGEILLYSSDDGIFFSYDLKARYLSGAIIAPNLERLHMIPYTKSFVSLKGLGEEGAQNAIKGYAK